jgi:hypothetical protein
LNGDLILTLGLSQVAAGGQNIAQIRVSRGEIRLQSNRFPKQLPGFVAISHFEQDVRQRIANLG